MKSLLRAFFGAAVAVFLVAGAGNSSDAARRLPARYAYDGVWSVVIYTMYGDCDRALRYSLGIQGGRVMSRDSAYQAYGQVAKSGAIRVTVAQGGRSASGAGRLHGNVGQGWWRTDTGKCSGKWTAERRAAAN